MAPPGRRLILDAEQVTTLRRHAEMHTPEECCGILVGHGAASHSEIHEVLPTRNVAEDRRRRYDIDPRQLLDAHRNARRDGHDIVGYFHSHPASPAVPSRTDGEHAWPDTSYVILGLENRQVTSLRSWRWVDGRFEEEEICIR